MCNRTVSEDELSHLLDYLEGICIYILVVLRVILERIGKCGKMKMLLDRFFLKGKGYGVSGCYGLIMGGTIGKIIKDTIHANGIDIGIYT